MSGWLVIAVGLGALNTLGLFWLACRKPRRPVVKLVPGPVPLALKRARQ